MEIPKKYQKQFERGMVVEGREHPWMIPNMKKRLVMDHILEHPRTEYKK